MLQLLLRYAKQETLDPLKSLVRFVAWGMAGSVLLAIGAVLVVLGVVRLAQTELAPHLNGHLSWVPYVIGLVLVLLAVGIVGSRLTKGPE